MDFPIVDLFDDDLSIAFVDSLRVLRGFAPKRVNMCGANLRIGAPSAIWLLKYLHQNELKCPHCRKSVEDAHVFRTTKKNRLTVYRGACQGIYNLYSGTVFEGKHFRPAQAILLLRGVCKSEPTATIAREIDVARQTAHDLRKAIQANAERMQPDDPLPAERTETDERFQNAGKKR